MGPLRASRSSPLSYPHHSLPLRGRPRSSTSGRAHGHQIVRGHSTGRSAVRHHEFQHRGRDLAWPAARGIQCLGDWNKPIAPAADGLTRQHPALRDPSPPSGITFRWNIDGQNRVSAIDSERIRTEARCIRERKLRPFTYAADRSTLPRSTIERGRLCTSGAR